MSDNLTYFRPLFIDPTTGVPSGVPDGAGLDIVGVRGPRFTVGGYDVVLSNTPNSSASTLQVIYNNSGSPATINLTPGKDFIVDVPNVPGASFKIDATTGAVTIGADLILNGSSTIVDSTIYKSDHIRLLGQSPSVPSLWIGPDSEQTTSTADLVIVTAVPGSTVNPSFKIDRLGHVSIKTLDVPGNLTVSGTINGVDVAGINTTLQNHIFVNGTFKHLAREINIDSGTISDLPVGTPRNAQSVLNFLDTSINNINSQIVGLNHDVDSLQSQINAGGGGTGGGSGQPVGYTYYASAPALQWVINHNRNNKNFIFMLFDENGMAFQPDNAEIIDYDTIVISFGAPQSGRANIMFYLE